MKMYRTSKWHDDITEHELIKRTPKTLTYVDGVSPFTGKEHVVREHIVSDSSHWFDTWEEANQFLIEKHKRKASFHSHEFENHREAVKILKRRTK